jgi:aspartyl-tRNA(Asn)/glutamyl-tRNA(Gln) amidotransferase subunit A
VTERGGLFELTAQELRAAYRDRTVSPVEVLQALVERIEAVNPQLGAFTTLCTERARDEAVAWERAYLQGDVSAPLAGVPFGVKDLFDSADVRTTYGSAMFANNVPPVDAAAIRRVREGGGILLGKTQTHEFAWGITSVNEMMGTSRNPWHPERISGGSSGGSAVALAAGMVPLAVGSDTGGSIRVPSAFCGTVGFKPTYGRVSTEGVWPLAPSLDHPGAMARTPADAALLLAAMEEPSRSTRLDRAPRRLASLVVGVCPDMHVVPLAAPVQAAFDAAVRTVADLGAELVELALPGAETTFATFGVIQRAEALRTHRRAGLYPGRAAEYGDDVRGRLESAESVTLDQYIAATADRERLRAAVAALFERVDLLLTPVSAVSPLPIGETSVSREGREVDFRELVMTYTVPQDLLGLPACAVRAGFDDLGIPIGVQLTGRRWGDLEVLEAAKDFADATPTIQESWPAVPPSRAIA